MTSVAKPTPAVAVAAYHRSCQEDGTRGAYARVGRALGVSDETVRRWVHAAEVAPVVDDLAYVDPPGGYPRPEPMPQAVTEMPQDVPLNDTEAVGDYDEGELDTTPQTTPHATPHGRAVARRPLPQPDEGQWWKTIHPQVWAVALAVLIVLVAFP